jgi:hypothetical protein
MNRTEVRAALKAVLNPEGELYKKALREHPEVPPDQVRQWIAMDLATPVAAVLAGQPEYHRCLNMMLQSGMGPQITFRPDRAAQLLVLNAMKSDADSAVNWLADLLENARASGLHVMPLWQLTIEAAITLTRDIELIPFSLLPLSPMTAGLEGPPDAFSVHWMLPGPLLGRQQPTAALTTSKVVDPLFVDAEEELRRELDPLPNILDDVRLCLSAIGPHPILGPVRWYQFDDPDLNIAAGGGIAGMPLEILPSWLFPPLALDAEAARTLVAKFLALPAKIRERARIALQRLFQAMLRREPGDKAADLSIALEALLTDQAGEHTWKVSTRAGMLTGWDLQSRLDRRNVIAATYRMRSSLVHSGKASKMIRVSKGDLRPADKVCEEATRICAAVVRAIIECGEIPSWPEFDVSGGVFGWPQSHPVARSKALTTGVKS